jgi:hypothetical protein
MEKRCAGGGLLLAGAIVAVIGLATGLTATLAIPREWTTFTVGVGLLALGALRRVIRGGGTVKGQGPQ